jgi:hypothetical protein
MKLTTIFCIFKKISKELSKFTLSQISVAVIIDGQTLLLQKTQHFKTSFSKRNVAGNICVKFGNVKFAEQGFLTAKKS